MSAAPYKPQPGTIPHKVLAYLHTLPAGGSVNSAMLAEAIDHDVSSMAACMKNAVSAGLVKVWNVPGDRKCWWSLGDGVPLARRREDHEAGGDGLDDLKGPAPTPNLATRSVFDLAAGTDGVHDAQRAETAEAAALPPALPPLVMVDDLESPGQAAAAVPAAAPSPVVAPTDLGENFGCALWSNGVLVLSVRGRIVELVPQETRELLRYLERMAESVEA